MRFETFVALRYLKAKRKQTMVSVISAISVIGIAAGVTALIVALALSTGFKEDIQAKIVGATSHINLLRLDSAPLRAYEPLLEKLSHVPKVTGVAPAIFQQVFIVGSHRSQGAFLKGIDVHRESRISDFLSHLIHGDARSLEREDAPDDPEAPPAPYPLVVGKEMARILGVKVGDSLRILVPQGRLTPFGMSASAKSFRLAAVFESGLWDLDANWAYTSMTAARKLLAMPPDSATVLQFRTSDLEGVQQIADEIQREAGSGLTTTTWIELNRPLFAALKLEKIALFVTIGLIIFVAALNIASTLIMMVLDKQRDIAILTAMGATQNTITIVFMLQGLVIGIAGTVIGAISGIGLCWVLDAYKLIQLEAEVYSIPYVPFHVKVLDVVLVCGTAVLISFLATLYPARRASRLNPVEAIRYE